MITFPVPFQRFLIWHTPFMAFRHPRFRYRLRRSFVSTNREAAE